MIKLIGALLTFGLFGGFVLRNEEGPGAEQSRLAVVELFTAEGCSSCPKADELLKEMTQIMARDSIRVLGLAFHVTYWDKHGWVDPYSQEKFTERQKKYVDKLVFTQISPPQIYTPQAIVNGEMEFVGSNPFAFRKNVISAAEQRPVYEITAGSTGQPGDVRLHYELNRNPKSVVLNIAVVEHYIEHYVERGENKQRTLKHSNVVRTFETIVPEKQGDIPIAWPADLSTEKGSIILYVQNPKTMKVVGASQVVPH